MSQTQDLPEPIHVAYLGPEASFSQQAALAVFPPKSSPAAVLHPLPSFGSIFSALQTSSSQNNITYTYALLPVENSTNGSVVQVLDLLSQCAETTYPHLEVYAEHYLEVHHCLFTHSNSNTHASQTTPESHNTNGIVTTPDDTNPNPKYSKIKTLYTHPQVWGQCNRFLSKHFPPAIVERIDVSSTSAAAKLVAQDETGTSAAISSILAGQVNRLDLLAENIEDEPGQNTTRFFVMGNRTRDNAPANLFVRSGVTNEPTVSERPQIDTSNNVSRRETDKEEKQFKSLITFTIPHTQPGSLADALAVFKARNLNLTSIASRPSRQRNWHYVFLVECEEKRLDGKEGEKNLRETLEELGKITENMRYLGSWIDQLQI